MGLKIIKAPSMQAGTEAAILSMKGDSVIVIVPDRYTLSIERDIYDTLSLSASFSLEVMSFSRLAASAVKKGDFLSKEGTVMLMKKALENLSGKLTYFGAITPSMEFAREVFAVVSSFRQSEISSARLRDIADRTVGSMKNKFLDIAMISDEYDTLVGEKYIDTISRIDAFVSCAANSDWVTQSDVFVIGFNTFSAKQLKVIRTLSAVSRSVTVTAVSNEYYKENPIFSFSTIQELQAIADGKAEETEVFPVTKEPGATIRRYLFSSCRPKILPSSEDKIRLVKAKNPFEETKKVACEINYLVRNGYRFKDIAIVIGSEAYKPCINELFPRFSIPYFIDYKYKATESSLFRYVKGLLELSIYNLKREKVLALVKQPFFGLSASDAAAFENYCLEFNVEYNGFLSEFKLKSINTEIAEIVRKKLLTVILPVLPGTVGGIAAVVLEAVDKILVLDVEPDEPRLKASFSSSVRIREILVEMSTLIADEVVTVEEFFGIFCSGCAELEIALLPTFVDSVFVGTTSESRFSGVKALFVLGANGDNFPLKSEEQTIVGNADIAALELNGAVLRPSPVSANRLEQFVVTDLLSRASRLYVCCSHYGMTGDGLTESDGFREIKELFRLPVSSECRELPENEMLAYRLSTDENAYRAYLSGDFEPSYAKSIKGYLEQKGYRFEKREKEENCDFKNAFFKDERDGKRTTVSQLETFFACPFKHFLKYGVGLRVRREAEYNVADIGTIVHGVMERFFVAHLSDLLTLSEAEIKSETEKAMAAVLAENRYEEMKSAPEQKYAVDSAMADCRYYIPKLLDIMKKGDFAPVAIEYGFGMEDENYIELPTKNGKFLIVGKIDRVDKCGDRILIIDYKTGKSQAKDSLDVVWYGKKIQLFVYMASLAKEGVPSGCLYFPIVSGYSKKGNKICYVGYLNGDIDTVGHFDRTMKDAFENGNDSASEFYDVKVKAKKTGTEIVGKGVLPSDGFDVVCGYVNALAGAAVDRICGGYTAKKAQEGACEYCDYASMCDTVEREYVQKFDVNIGSFYRGNENG